MRPLRPLARKYLSDPTEDVRVATENQLAEFLREIKEVTLVQKRYAEDQRLKELAAAESQAIAVEGDPPPSADPALAKEDVFESSEPDADAETGTAISEYGERDLGSKYFRCIPTLSLMRCSLGARPGREAELRRDHRDPAPPTRRTT